MPQFSEKDINEAKRRVWEMQNRASHFVDENTKTTRENNSNNSAADVPPLNKEKTNPEKNIADNERQSDKKGEDKSLAIILALILILSSEGADNTLILALLYLLL